MKHYDRWSGEGNYKNGEKLNFSTIFYFFNACMSGNALDLLQVDSL